MGKVIKNSSGQVVLSGDKALEVTAAIDSNIVAGNIKKDVEILGVTGTYEGSDNIAVSANIPRATSLPSGGMLPNVYYDLGWVTSTTTFAKNETGLDSSILNIWAFGFDVDNSPTVYWPDWIEWANGTPPTLTNLKHYEVTIIGDYAMYAEFPTTNNDPEEI